MRKYRFSVAVAALVCVLLLAGVMLAHANSGSDPPTWYAVEQGTASGGGYHLTALRWQVSGLAGGEGYRLLSPLAPSLRGSGCCCTFLPCLLRNH